MTVGSTYPNINEFKFWLSMQSSISLNITLKRVNQRKLRPIVQGKLKIIVPGEYMLPNPDDYCPFCLHHT
uniref:Uncharacterized protein n=1 Tax=Arundo donax TaxID=35708 RepID=A0A0A9H6J8_ARUDO